MEKLAYQQLRDQLNSRFSSGGQSDGLAFLVISGVSVLSALGIMLSFSGSLGIWFLGQVLLGVSILQWFVLLHDLGHGCFFKTPILNEIFGHIASGFVLLPFYPWRYIHAAHHVWTGWQDLDPTMSQIKSRDLSPGSKRVAEFCWKYWIPIFALTFSFGNFWNLPKISKSWKDNRVRLRCVWSCIYVLLVFGIAVFLRPIFFIKIYALAYFLFLFISDPLLLSQHSHIKQKISHGEKVSVVPTYEQDLYTRSLVFPDAVSKWLLLYFDRHGVHHFFPNLPLYRLAEVRTPVKNQIAWHQWLKLAKAMPVDQMLLESRDQSGIAI